MSLTAADRDEEKHTLEDKAGTETGTITAGSSIADSPQEDQQEPEHVPDGGREAYTVVLGASLALFASAGMVNTYVRTLNVFADLLRVNLIAIVN